jgi:hypothetical protein
MWWVDQMVKQADGSYIPPRSVTETIVATVTEYYALLRADSEEAALDVAKRVMADRQILATRYFTGSALAGLLSTRPPQFQVGTSGRTAVIDVRGFGPEGLAGFYTILVTGTMANVYSTSDWTLVARNVKVADFYETWRVVFDAAAGTWKIDSKLAGGLK